ncbi:MAG TPA: isochorismatase family protein, partial [Thermomicrobiales bacterium]|nr:isochorismatase family protein [Thermomicrobiales bacterium]
KERPMPAWSDLISDGELEVYRRAGYQQRFGLGERPALLIIDVEYNFTGDVREPILDSIAKYSDRGGEMAWDAIPQIARLLAIARARGLPVAYTHGTEQADTVQTPKLGTAIVAEIAPRPGELVIAKSAASAFFGTSLASFFIRHRVDTVIHAGCVTSGCVRASVVDGAAYGFKNAIVEECVFDRALTPHIANLFDMDAKYGDVMSLAAIEEYLQSLPA